MKSVLVTGSNGGIGTAICSLLKDNGYYVIGTDLESDENNLDDFIQFDLRDITICRDERARFACEINQIIDGSEFSALVNNAALQVLSGMDDLDIEDFRATIDINLTAPLVLSKILYNSLKENKGSILNIGSIHAKLTKPAFISYSTSKSALLGLTQSMAVDIGSNVRVNAIQPAATATEMLLDGFKGQPEAYAKLEAFHPSNCIAKPIEIAEAVFFMISDRCRFMNGAILDVNGGIGCRLHDPV